MIESSRMEFKRTYTEDIEKEIVAFANSDGGELIIGMDYDGSIIGVDKPDEASARVTNMLRDAISPDINLITNVNITYQQNKPLVHVTVSKDCKRPYYITRKGMTSSGVYVRHGNTSAPAPATNRKEIQA